MTELSKDNVEEFRIKWRYLPIAALSLSMMMFAFFITLSMLIVYVTVDWFDMRTWYGPYLAMFSATTVASLVLVSAMKLLSDFCIWKVKREKKE